MPMSAFTRNYGRVARRCIGHPSAIRLDCLILRRWQSTNRSGRGEPFQADGLPFTVSPEEATENFYKWAYDEQGLRYLISPNQVRLAASYCPVWSFDVNVRYVVTDSHGQRKFGWKPEVFRAAYGSQSVIFLPGLSAYAGYTYRRTLLNPLHNISLVFLGNQTVPFGNWMLRDMKLKNGQSLQIYPDPWNTTKARALLVVKDELKALASESEHPATHVQIEVVACRRVYMPTYVFAYKLLGAEYTVFVSGCDAGAGVSGDSHQVFQNTEPLAPSPSFLDKAFGNAQTAARVLGPRGLAAGLQLLLAIAGRLLIRLPLIASVATLFVGFRKVVQPFIRNQFATAAWERQREYEALMDDEMADTFSDFTDSGSARAYYEQNRGHILRHLSASEEHTRGDYDWYASWEAWAREQYRKQQGQDQEKQSAGKPRTSRTKQEFQWDFNPEDPYSVLGVDRRATNNEISAAYRKQMLAHHPDLQSGRSEAEKQRAMERTKLINEAYRQLKTTKR